MLDLVSGLTVTQNIEMAAHSSNEATNGATVSLANNASAVVVFVAGVVTDGTHTPTVEESNDGSTWTTVAAADLSATLTAFTSAADQAVQVVGYKGSAGNIRAVITDATSTSGGITGAVVILGHKHQVGGSPIIT